jgi:hypothetical protein
MDRLRLSALRPPRLSLDRLRRLRLLPLLELLRLLRELALVLRLLLRPRCRRRCRRRLEYEDDEDEDDDEPDDEYDDRLDRDDAELRLRLRLRREPLVGRFTVSSRRASLTTGGTSPSRRFGPYDSSRSSWYLGWRWCRSYGSRRWSRCGR